MAQTPLFSIKASRFFDVIHDTFQLTTDEQQMLKRNGFLVSERLHFEDFATAYAYLHWKDLPVLITTDSLLHALQQTYDDMLIMLESRILTRQLINFLMSVHRQVRSPLRRWRYPSLTRLIRDLDIYLSVPLEILCGTQDTKDVTEEDHFTWEESYPERVAYLKSRKLRPETSAYLELIYAAAQPARVTLFGSSQLIDFTLFKPRGHYTKSATLKRYFLAMSWLSHISFVLVRFLNNSPSLDIQHLTAATLLAHFIKQADAKKTFDAIDNFISALVGPSDNITLADLERFLLDSKTLTPLDIARHSQPDTLLQLLLTEKYGQQRIIGEMQATYPNSSQPTRPDISFKLLGQRFAPDSFILSKLVYDRLIVNSHKVERLLPSPMDALYALGNDRALNHLEQELDLYNYKENLQALREEFDAQDEHFWRSSFYQRFLGMLRTLHVSTTGEMYPAVMHSEAWADKMLHTQLASWARLRHDNILYTKQSSTVMLMCEYPTGYVEPYPAFYAAMRDYALAGQQLFADGEHNGLAGSDEYPYLHMLHYFQHLEQVATRLHLLAEKELRHEPFTQEEQEWIRETAVSKIERCGSGGDQEIWSGWYPKLFPFASHLVSPAVIADVHTLPASDLSPVSKVLHVATGSVAALLFMVDDEQGTTTYAGPASTYYEVVTEGEYPVRLTDHDWQERLEDSSRPDQPSWTKTFRSTGVQLALSLPQRQMFR